MSDILSIIANPEITLPSSVFKLTLSLILGGLIGMERKSRGQIAGMRTFSLISMGATLAMIISIYIPQTYMDFQNGDPGRIASQVISGIGFLGAGAIIQMKGSVKGLTTAAGIWITAAIGMGIGAGMYLIAIAATALIMLVLTNVEQHQHRFFKTGARKTIHIKINGIAEDLEPYKQLFKKFDLEVMDNLIKNDYQENATSVSFAVLAKGKVDFLRLFKEVSTNCDIKSISLSNEMDD